MANLSFNRVVKQVIVLSPDTELTVQELYDKTIDFQDEPANLDLNRMISGSGKEPLGGGVFVGVTVSLLDGWQVFFQTLSNDTKITGGNLVGFDSLGAIQSPLANTNIVQLTSASSATLSQQSSLEFSSFSGGVTVDFVNGVAGTVFPTGTLEQPVNNWDDALTIASTRGLPILFILGNATIDGNRDFSEFVFIGQSINLTTIIVDPLPATADLEFQECNLTGTIDGNVLVKNCFVTDLSGLSGDISNSLISGTLTLVPSAAPFQLIDCADAEAFGGVPIIDGGGSSPDFLVRNWNGGLQINNVTNAVDVSIDMHAGRLIMDSTVTAGSFLVRGIGRLIDNSTGTSITSAELLGNPSIADAVWEEATVDHDTDGTFGGFIQNKLLTVAKFLGLK